MLILSQEHNNIKFQVLCIWSADKYFQQFSFVIVVAAAAGEDPQGMHPNQMAGNLASLSLLVEQILWQHLKI